MLRRGDGKLGFLLVSLLIFIFIYPLFEGYAQIKQFIGVYYVVILAAGIYAVSYTQGHMLIGLVLGIPAILLTSASTLAKVPLLLHAVVLSTVAFFVFAIYSILRFVMRDPARFSRNDVLGAVSVYLLIGLTFALIYGHVEWVSPESFYYDAARDRDALLSFSDFIYFSFISLTTVGYGDLTAIRPVARSLAILEGLVGVFYMSLLIARVVSLYAGRARE